MAHSNYIHATDKWGIKRPIAVKLFAHVIVSMMTASIANTLD
jgi:hypothetical protein